MIYNDRWTVGFFNIGNAPDDSRFFGCATLGASDGSGVHGADEAGTFVWGRDIPGTVICGSVQACEADLRQLAPDQAPRAALAFFSDGAYAERFLAIFRRRFPDVPIAGGTAAGAPGGEIRPVQGEVCLLLMHDRCAVFCESVQTDTRRRVRIIAEADHPRAILRFSEDGTPCDAIEYWRRIQREYRLEADNFECATLSSAADVNIHMSIVNGRLMSGADCVPDAPYKLRYADPATITARVRAFAEREDSLIIGCAGLKQRLIEVPKAARGSLIVFLYGEIADGRFGNLMMTGIRNI